MTVRIVETIISVANWITVKVKVISATRSLHKATSLGWEEAGPLPLSILPSRENSLLIQENVDANKELPSALRHKFLSA